MEFKHLNYFVPKGAVGSDCERLGVRISNSSSSSQDGGSQGETNHISIHTNKKKSPLLFPPNLFPFILYLSMENWKPNQGKFFPLHFRFIPLKICLLKKLNYGIMNLCKSCY